MLRRIPADGLLTVCVISWGLNFTATKYAQEHGFTPLAYAAPRLALAALLLSAIAARRERDAPRMGAADLGRAVAVGAVLVFGNQLSFGFSFHFASAAVIALLFGTMPIVALLLSAALGLECVRPLQWLAAAVSFAGVGLVAAGAHGGGNSSALGIVLGLTSPFTFVVYSLALAPLVRRHGAFRVNALACSAAAIPLLGVSIPALASLDWGHVTALAWLCLGFSAAAFALPNLLWFIAIDRVGAARATLWANAQPFAGTLFAVLILAERIGSLTYIGGGVLAVGIVLARLRRGEGPSAARGAEPESELALAAVPPHE